VLAIGLPTIGLIYYLDRHVDAGPSIPGRAVAAAEEAVRQNPNQLSCVVLAQAYTADNRPADAIDQYTIVLGAEPANATALLAAATCSRTASTRQRATTGPIEVAKDTTWPTSTACSNGLLRPGRHPFAQDNRASDAAGQRPSRPNRRRRARPAGQSLIAIGDYRLRSALSDAVASVTGCAIPHPPR
jgi:hypothetical protein